jgi:hypothetical protein
MFEELWPASSLIADHSFCSMFDLFFYGNTTLDNVLFRAKFAA